MLGFCFSKNFLCLPLHVWWILQREYFKQGKIDQFRQILEEGSSPGTYDTFKCIEWVFIHSYWKVREFKVAVFLSLKRLIPITHCYGAEIDEYYADVRYERIAILNALGAYYSYLGKIETNQREKEEHFIMATQYYNKASRIDMHEPTTWVGKGDHYFISLI